MVVSHILLVYREHREYIPGDYSVVSHILLVNREHREYIPGDYRGGFSHTPGI